MLKPLISLITALQLLISGAGTPQAQLQLLFQSGVMLRMHVVAQDDTEAMQRIKLCVRDAVQACYQQNSPGGISMLENTRDILPLLEASAIACAQSEGFAGTVRVALETRAFDELPLAENSVPAGEYPALMIYLGDAQGHNWWGLIDPELSLWLCRIDDDESPAVLRWDWSFKGLLEALFRKPIPDKEVPQDACLI